MQPGDRVRAIRTIPRFSYDVQPGTELIVSQVFSDGRLNLQDQRGQSVICRCEPDRVELVTEPTPPAKKSLKKSPADQPAKSATKPRAQSLFA